MLNHNSIWFPHETCPLTIDPTEFAEHVSRHNTPMLLRGSDVVSSASTRWSKAYLKTAIDTKHKHTVYYSKHDGRKRFMYSKEQKFSKDMNILSFFKTIEKHATLEADDPAKFYFYFQSELTKADHDKPIFKDLEHFNWGLLKQASQKWGELTKNVLYINSNQGTVTPVHYDEQQNIYAQIRGTKRFILFPPSQFPHLYPFPVHHPNDRQCQVDLSQPDYKRWPKLDRLKNAYICDLEPGDILHIPSYWFHEVHTSGLDPEDDLNISINFWYLDAPATVPTPGSTFTAKNYLCITRNIEKMLAQVVSNPEEDVGALLRMMSEGRFQDSAEFKMDPN